MSHRPRQRLRQIDPGKYRQQDERRRTGEQRGFFTDLFRGYLYFSNRASCYIVVGCVVIFGPLCGCVAAIYWLYLR
jgi:hypothetical protein